MKHRICFLLFFLNIFFQSNAQTNAVIDTIPFSLEKKLLVFKGKINGVETDFAFDTGAEVGVANTNNLAQAKFTVKSSGKRVNDSNNKTTKLSKIVIDSITIGTYQFTNIKSVMADMEFLQCNSIYLLGMDVIGQLNWQIDFYNHKMYCSERPFNIDSSYQQLVVKNAIKRPLATITINNKMYNNCLIDLGFSGVLEIAETNELNSVYETKKNSNQASLLLSSSMGIAGLGKIDTIKRVELNTIEFAGVNIKNVPINIREKIDIKLGINFFASTCSNLILNHSAGNYYMQVDSKKTFDKNLGLDIRISMVDKKLMVTGKNIMPQSTAANFEINEEVKSVNGKTVNDFESSCEYFNWFFFLKDKTIVVEKLTGEKITIRSQSLE